MTSPTYGAGKFGDALASGSGLTNVSPTGTNWTFEFRFNTSASGGSNKVAFSLGSSGSLYVCMDPSGHMVCNLISGASSAAYNDGADHHCALVGTAAGVTLFVDGAIVGSVATPMNLPASQPITIHRHQSFSGFDWVGSIDEFVIWTISKYTAAFAPPTTAYASGQANMLSLYHFNDDGTDSAPVVTNLLTCAIVAQPTVAGALAANIISITNTKVNWSPGNWDFLATYKVSACVGAYVQVAVTGTTTFSVNLDNSMLISSGLAAASWPRLRIIYDGITAVDTQITSAMSSVTRTGLSTSAHTIEVYLDAMDDNSGDLYISPTNALRITGFTIDDGASATQWTPLGKIAYAFGDSTARGYKGLSFTDTMPAGNSNAITVFPLIAKARGCELGLIAYSGQGYEVSGGNTPPFPTAYQFFSSGRSRLVAGLFSPQPDEIWIMHGTNGSTTQADVQDGFTKMRTAAPNALIFAIVPLGGFARAVITAAVAAQGDAKIYLIDIGDKYAVGINNYTQVQNYWSWDGLHPNEHKNAACAAAIVGQMRVAQPALTARTVSFTVRNAAGPMANLTGLQVSIFDDPTRAVGSPIRYQTLIGTTDANGLFTATYQSALPSGGTCGIDVRGAGVNMAINPTVT